MSEIPLAVVTWHQVLAFGLAALIIIAIPGPSVLFVVGRALTYGRPVALSSVLGNTLGLACAMVLVALGLGAVVAESVVVFTVIKLVGAAYMIWLGVQALRHRRALHVEPDKRRPAIGLGRAVRQGFVVGISNPKGFIMFAAVLPQFVDRGAGHVQLQMLLLGLLAFAIGMVSDSTWAIVASRLRSWFLSSAKRGEAMGAVGGLSMIGLGVGLAVTGEAGR
jgi:threonine/homoserine/homoserine lactone efflux protein